MKAYSEITPEIFSQNITDRDRHRWTTEKLWWIWKSQDEDTRLIVTTDKMTGHAEGLVRLGGIRKTPGYGTFQVLIVDENPEIRPCWHSIDKIGAIMEVGSMTAKGLKWTALDLQRTAKAENPYYEMHESFRQSDRARFDRRMEAMDPLDRMEYRDLHAR